MLSETNLWKRGASSSMFELTIGGVVAVATAIVALVLLKRRR